jgi:hypothetical protein
MTKKAEVLFQSTPVEKDGRVLVQSTCVVCGFTIVGSVSEDLLEQQQCHVQSVHAQAVSPASSSD